MLPVVKSSWAAPIVISTLPVSTLHWIVLWFKSGVSNTVSCEVKQLLLTSTPRPITAPLLHVLYESGYLLCHSIISQPISTIVPLHTVKSEAPQTVHSYVTRCPGHIQSEVSIGSSSFLAAEPDNIMVLKVAKSWSECTQSFCNIVPWHIYLLYLHNMCLLDLIVVPRNQRKIQ